MDSSLTSNNIAQLISSLNPEQRKGLETTQGPILVIAGAGSGKTKMLTARITHLMADLHVPGQHILAVTFTNKAAEEMRNRVTHSLGMAPDSFNPPPFFMASANAYSQPLIGTFHSICARILRREIDRTPYSKQFVIFDDSDQLSLVKDCFNRLNISDKSFAPKSFQWAINSAKCDAIEPSAMTVDSFDLYAKNLQRVYALYQEEMFKHNAIDFGEIITLTYKVLRDNPDVLNKYQELYQYIHVDEYQDTNKAQYLLVRLLADKYKNIFVVGDEDQSIYSWRGADIQNILDFEKDYPNAQVIKLEQNYRSTQTIINASSELIANNSARKSKRLWTENETGSLIQRFQVSDERAEAELVVSKIRETCQDGGHAYSDIALFYRTNAQSRVLEDALRRSRIPYKIIGGLKFYDRKEIKDILAYFKALSNGEDSVSFRRIINVPARGIGKTTVDKIDEIAIQKGFTFENALRASVEHDLVGSGPKKKIADFIKKIDELRILLKEKPVLDFYHELLDRTGYVQELKAEGTEEALARIENLQEFNSTLTEFGFQDIPAIQTLPLLLESVALISEESHASEESPSGTVSLMTLHMSKGLEFNLVFIVGMEEGLFPSLRGDDALSDDSDELEEERRLCYVGMTRARKELILTHAVCRRIYGNILYNDPARFFSEIPAKFVEFKDLARFNRQYTSNSYGDSDNSDIEYSYSPRTTMAASSYASSDSSPIGRRVRHSVYGEGVIRSFEGTESALGDGKVTIEFAGKMTKKFILKFANLEYL